MAISRINGVGSNTTYKASPTAKKPAEVSMESVEEAQIRGYSQGVINSEDGNNLLNVAEGGLSAIEESLQNIRELSVKASSDILSDDDKSSIQDEIKANLASIEDISKGTEYNTKKLLDGSTADINLATDPSGKGMEIKLESSTLDKLGISGYDVTGNFDITDIDKAIAMVNESRSSIGAAQSALESQINIGNVSSVELDDNIDEKLQEMIDNKSNDDKKRVLDEYSKFATMSKLKEQSSSIEKLLNIK